MRERRRLELGLVPSNGSGKVYFTDVANTTSTTSDHLTVLTKTISEIISNVTLNYSPEKISHEQNYSIGLIVYADITFEDNGTVRHYFFGNSMGNQFTTVQNILADSGSWPRTYNISANKSVSGFVPYNGTKNIRTVSFSGIIGHKDMAHPGNQWKNLFNLDTTHYTAKTPNIPSELSNKLISGPAAHPTSYPRESADIDTYLQNLADQGYIQLTMIQKQDYYLNSQESNIRTGPGGNLSYPNAFNTIGKSDYWIIDSDGMLTNKHYINYLSSLFTYKSLVPGFALYFDNVKIIENANQFYAWHYNMAKMTGSYNITKTRFQNMVLSFKTT